MRRLLISALIALVAAPAMAAQQNITTISSVTASREALRTAVNSRLTAADANFDELYAAIGTRPWVAQTTAPADTTLLWFDTDQVPGEVVLKIYTGGAWVAHSVGTGGTAVAALNDLTDVDTSGAVNGSVLKYADGTWVIGTDDVGTGSFSWPASDGAYYAARNGAWTSLTGLYQGADDDLTTLASPTNWRVFYSNGSGVITQLALGAAGTYLKSNGASLAPTWATPSAMVYPGAGVPQSTGSSWGTSLTVGTSSNNLLQLNGSGQLPAVPGTLLTDTYTGTILSGQTTMHAAIQALGTEVENSPQATTAGVAIMQAADYAAMRALLDLEPGTDFNAYDADIADLADDGSLTASKVEGAAVKTASKATTYTIGTDSASEAYGGTVYVTSATTITAPAVAAGMNFSVVTIGDIAVSLDVNASDKMILDGVTLADGDKATNSSKAGDTITCQYYSADGFYCWSGTVLGGHWTDGN